MTEEISQVNATRQFELHTSFLTPLDPPNSMLMFVFLLWGGVGTETISQADAEKIFNIDMGDARGLAVHIVMRYSDAGW